MLLVFSKSSGSRYEGCTLYLFLGNDLNTGHSVIQSWWEGHLELRTKGGNSSYHTW